MSVAEAKCRTDTQEEKPTRRPKFHKDEMQPVSVLVASVLGDKALLQKLESFVMNRTYTHTFRKTRGGFRGRQNLYRPSSCLARMRGVNQSAAMCQLRAPSACNNPARISLVTFPIQKL